jgi:hypothetical protein
MIMEQAIVLQEKKCKTNHLFPPLPLLRLCLRALIPDQPATQNSANME